MFSAIAPGPGARGILCASAGQIAQIDADKERRKENYG